MTHFQPRSIYFNATFVLLLGAAVLGSVVLGASSCVDPARQAAIDALGPEAAGVEEGPIHRPGQPCLLCHGEDGFEDQFSVAGTVYQYREAGAGLDNARVTFTDANGQSASVVTNCVGNFYVEAGDYQPSYPLFVTVTHNGVERPMKTPIFAEESCAGCHVEPASPTSAGRVYFADEPMVFPASRPCPEDD